MSLDEEQTSEITRSRWSRGRSRHGNPSFGSRASAHVVVVSDRVRSSGRRMDTVKLEAKWPPDRRSTIEASEFGIYKEPADGKSRRLRGADKATGCLLMLSLMAAAAVVVSDRVNAAGRNVVSRAQNTTRPTTYRARPSRRRPLAASDASSYPVFNMFIDSGRGAVRQVLLAILL